MSLYPFVVVCLYDHYFGLVVLNWEVIMISDLMDVKWFQLLLCVQYRFLWSAIYYIVCVDSHHSVIQQSMTNKSFSKRSLLSFFQ